MPSVWQQSVLEQLAKILAEEVTQEDLEEKLDLLVKRKKLVATFARSILVAYRLNTGSQDLLTALRYIPRTTP